MNSGYFHKDIFAAANVAAILMWSVETKFAGNVKKEIMMTDPKIETLDQLREGIAISDVVIVKGLPQKRRDAVKAICDSAMESRDDIRCLELAREFIQDELDTLKQGEQWFSTVNIWGDIRIWGPRDVDFRIAGPFSTAFVAQASPVAVEEFLKNFNGEEISKMLCEDKYIKHCRGCYEALGVFMLNSNTHERFDHSLIGHEFLDIELSDNTSVAGIIEGLIERYQNISGTKVIIREKFPTLREHPQVCPVENCGRDIFEEIIHGIVLKCPEHGFIMRKSFDVPKI